MVTARSLNKRSTTILIAVVLALGTGLLLFNYLGTVAHTAQAVPVRSIVVAAHDIPPRTVITQEMLTVVDRPQDSVDSDASTSLGAVVGQVAFIDIPAGSALSSSKIGRLATGGLTMRVPVGQRAISIALDPVKGVADLVRPGDRVDVIAVTQTRGSNEAPRAATILRDKVVLAMGSTMDASGAGAGGATTSGSAVESTVQTATLSVLPHEAKVLALADLNATLRLALRSPREPNRSQPDDAFILAAPAAPQTVVAPAPARAPAPVVQRKAPSGIPMIDGDRVVR
ncbi:MAG TPA: Flp pilus assembly protein CpaB [Candidatus Aquilonibacter sp.]